MAHARRAQSSSTTAQEITGLSLLVLGLLLFLALISYTPRDLPAWLTHVDRPNATTQNFVGSLGAILARLSYASLGAASFLLAAALIGHGVTALFSRNQTFVLRPAWTAVFVLSGACLLHVLGWSLIDSGKMNIDSEGGKIGYYLGGKL